jgi:arsenate reductase
MNTNSNTFSNLDSYVAECTNNFDSINDERKTLLAEVASYIRNKSRVNEPVKLIFICTHNSRRSHISQIWAQKASYVYGIKDVQCYSAGTEATAFNPRGVKAMSEAGFIIEKTSNSSNPVYSVAMDAAHEPLKVFSKEISDSANPSSDFGAIMTCSSANEACPVITGADIRFPVMYEDPKVADDTPEEANKYNERVRQIGTEMLYMFSLV